MPGGGEARRISETAGNTTVWVNSCKGLQTPMIEIIDIGRTYFRHAQ